MLASKWLLSSSEMKCIICQCLREMLDCLTKAEGAREVLAQVHVGFTCNKVVNSMTLWSIRSPTGPALALLGGVEFKTGLPGLTQGQIPITPNVGSCSGMLLYLRKGLLKTLTTTLTVARK